MKKARVAIVSGILTLCATWALAQPPVQPGSGLPGRGKAPGHKPGKQNFMAKLDVNQDHRVSTKEFLQIFRDLDRDNNGYITANEAPKGPPMGHGRRGEGPGRRGEGPQHRGRHRNFMSDLDANKDGRVGRDEFDGPMEHFSQFDKDGDGYITANEAPTGPPPGSGPTETGPQGPPPLQEN